MEVTVKIENMEEVINDFRGIADDQIPYAAALSLTRTAKRAQAKVQEMLPMRFTIRQQRWAKLGIRVEPATKKDLEAAVKDINYYMQLQETGGLKLPRHGGKIAIPLFRVPSNGFIPDDKTPEAIMASGVGFIGGKVMYLRGKHYKRAHKFMRVRGPGAAMTGYARDKLIPMYALVDEAKIPARYGFEQIIKAVVDEIWPEEFGRAFAEALATRR
jgi:hypothetical protein